MRWVFAFVLCSLGYALNIVNGIAFYVNDEPVTLYELYKTAQVAKISRDEALELLITQKIQDEEVARYHLSASELEIDEMFREIAARNRQSVESMRENLQAQGVDLEYYRNDVKKRVLQKKLYAMIVSQNIELADESELQQYYEQHRSDFLIPTHIKIIRYGASSRELLEHLVSQSYPLGSVPPTPSGVLSAPEEIETARLNPQLTALLMEVPVGKFTPIFNIGGEFVAFWVLSKSGGVAMPFEESKQLIFGKIMREKEGRVLAEHFEKLRAAAKITILRLN
ncbi:MAG: peptidyl-prolyl cis-trans isomerase [Helicobacter sp.]|nr:peptidyl-prolyl cis-trans isomerase [Helicobacter sp.]MDE6044719.1 hypothetical protein [Helicobacter sp.]MDE7196721.1 hypothetical protein [Helicobacter sp.]